MQHGWLEGSGDGLYQPGVVTELLLHGHHSSLQEEFEWADNISSKRTSHGIRTQAGNWAEEALWELRLFHRPQQGPQAAAELVDGQTLHAESPSPLSLSLSAAPTFWAGAFACVTLDAAAIITNTGAGLPSKRQSKEQRRSHGSLFLGWGSYCDK